MAFTVITLSRVPPSLRGDLSKWMQQIDTGVYVGNLNPKVREALWQRIAENIRGGQASMSYSCRSELGYRFETLNTQRYPVDFDGVPLVLLNETPAEEADSEARTSGFSDAAKFHQARKFSKRRPSVSPRAEPDPESSAPFCVIDIETDGLDPKRNRILEIGAIRTIAGKQETFHALLTHKSPLPKEITELTGLTDELLAEQGQDPELVLKEFLSFIDGLPIVGFNLSFDLAFIEKSLLELKLGRINARKYDLMLLAKKEKKFLRNYKLPTVLEAYGIHEEIPHRALDDARIIFELSKRIDSFAKLLRQHEGN